MCTLIADQPNRLVLDPPHALGSTYALQGFLEIDLGPESEEEGAALSLAVTNVNIHGALRHDAAPQVPRKMHGRLAIGTTPEARIDAVTGDAVLCVRIAVEYPELHDHASRLVTPGTDVLPWARPLSFDVVLKVHYDSVLGGFQAIGAGLLEAIPGVPGAVPTPGLVILACLCDSGVKCLTCCVTVKVATKNGTPVKSDDDVKEIVDKANQRWGCPGQCCIKFKLKEIKKPATLPTNPTLTSGAYSAEFDTINGIDKDADCYNVYLVDKINNPNIEGQTGFGTKNISILNTSGLSNDDVGVDLAHEMGHAMGLAKGPGTEPNGVTAHSSNNDNLMQPSARASKGKLNAKQCSEARKSDLLKKTDDSCTSSPQEA